VTGEAIGDGEAWKPFCSGESSSSAALSARGSAEMLSSGELCGGGRVFVTHWHQKFDMDKKLCFKEILVFLKKQLLSLRTIGD